MQSYSSPVLDNPVFLALGGDPIADRKHGMIDVILVTVAVIVHT